MRTERLIRTQQAYDSHCNLVLGEVEETVYVVDDEDEAETVRVRTIRCARRSDIGD